jgi:diguanylate cyclase (GGDEF)-like protein
MMMTEGNGRAGLGLRVVTPEATPSTSALPADVFGQGSEGGGAHSVEAKGAFRPTFRPRGSVVALPQQWVRVMAVLDIAFQPIISIHSARCLGVEALIRNHKAAGFETIPALFDAAHAEDCLAEVEAAIYEKAIHAFLRFDNHQDLKLFLNVDGRTLEHALKLAALLEEIAQRAQLHAPSLVLEISESQPIPAAVGPQAELGASPAVNPPGKHSNTENALHGLQVLRQITGRLSIDDFGSGYSSFALLYGAQPEYIKINRYFLGDIARDNRKKIFLRHMINLAHLLGIQVVAEGIENEREFLICKDIGCDLVQGFLLAEPEIAPPGSYESCDKVSEMNSRDRRSGPSDQRLIAQEVDYIIPISDSSELAEVFERVRLEHSISFFPVINSANEPMGLLRESDLKSYAYSPFGRELLTNKGYGRQVVDFLIPCPVADINTPAEKILEIFSADETSEGLLIVEDGAYSGFLSARSLLRILNEKNLAMARDQNPLTKLPGNAMINEFLSGAMADTSASYVIAYIDFDNFKPFNDTYGFRQGDRAITLFADILNKDLPRENCFIGHVGGDDYFSAFRDVEFEDAQAMVRHVIERFRQEVESFYDADARSAGYIVAKDREGNERHMPLLAASAALVHIPRGHAPGSIDDISSVIAVMKKEAKVSPTKLAAVSIISLPPLSDAVA